MSAEVMFPTFSSYSQSEQAILDQASHIIAERFVRHGVFCSPEATQQYLSCKLARYEREVFALMLLDNQNQLIEFRELFYGTVDSAAVYPREVVKAVLQVNAAAVIFAHNHPSGIAEPSSSDIQITRRLIDALSLVEVRVLDHIIVGSRTMSFAERGLL